MRFLMLTLLLSLPLAVEAKALFYQPQNADSAVGPDAWGNIFADMQSEGFDQLVIQWAQYGEADFGGRDGWLAATIKLAAEMDIEVVLGLYADPDFFQNIRASDGEVAAYLNAYLIKNLHLLDQLLASPIARNVRGWYLPAEFDDRYWATQYRRSLVHDQLTKWNAAVESRSKLPWSTSTFFTGWQSPDSYAEWLNSTEFQWWIQDGSGTGVLSESQRALYLKPVAASNVHIILEAFEQHRAQEVFSAGAKTGDSVVRLEQQYRAMGFQQVGVFSLRYLPFAREAFAGTHSFE